MLFYLLICIFVLIFPFAGIRYEPNYYKYTSLICFGIVLGIYLYQRQRLKGTILGFYKWIKNKDYEYYTYSKYFYFMVITFITILFINVKYLDITSMWYYLLGNSIFLFLFDIKDGEKEIDELTVRDYLIFIIVGLLGVHTIGFNSASLLYFRKSKLKSEECYNIYSCNLIAICIALIVKNFNINFTIESLFLFIISIIVSYIYIFIFRYLHSLNRLKWLGLIIMIICSFMCIKMII